ncbi:MAG: response regulator [Erythrobacter sp.]|nr:response regulator [Erythrobacter sp.]
MAHVMMADDDDIILEVFSDAFRRAGHSVGMLTNGLEVLEALAERSADLLVLDCTMPEKTGIEVLRELRTSSRHYLLPIMMLTARNSRNDRELALNSSADLYYTKDVDPDWFVFQAEELMASKGRRMTAEPPRATTRRAQMRFC